MKRKEPIKLPEGWKFLKPCKWDWKGPKKVLPKHRPKDWEVEIIERERKLREKIEATLRKHGKANEKGLKLVQKAIQRQKDWANKYISFFGSHDRAVDFELFHDRLKELEKTLGFGQQNQGEQIFELQNSLNSRGQGITIGRRTPDNEPKEITPRPNEVDQGKEGREDSKPETQTSKGLSEKFYEWLRKQERSKGNLFLLACRVSDFDVKGEKENLGNKEFNNKYSKKIGLQLDEISACVNKARFKVSSGEELLDTLNRTGIDRVKTLLRTLKSEAPLDNDSKSKIDELLKLIEY